MARTRNASRGFHQDDGVILGKGGVPIPTSPHMPTPIYVAPLDRQGAYISPAAAHITPPRNMSGHQVVRGPGAEPVAVLGAIIGYRADALSWSRNMESWELARLLDLAFKNPDALVDGFVINLSVADYGLLDGNLRRHFMPVRG